MVPYSRTNNCGEVYLLSTIVLLSRISLVVLCGEIALLDSYGGIYLCTLRKYLHQKRESTSSPLLNLFIFGFFRPKILYSAEYLPLSLPEASDSRQYIVLLSTESLHFLFYSSWEVISHSMSLRESSVRRCKFCFIPRTRGKRCQGPSVSDRGVLDVVAITTCFGKHFSFGAKSTMNSQNGFFRDSSEVPFETQSLLRVSRSSSITTKN